MIACIDEDGELFSTELELEPIEQFCAGLEKSSPNEKKKPPRGQAPSQGRKLPERQTTLNPTERSQGRPQQRVPKLPQLAQLPRLPQLPRFVQFAGFMPRFGRAGLSAPGASTAPTAPTAPTVLSEGCAEVCYGFAVYERKGRGAEKNSQGSQGPRPEELFIAGVVGVRTPTWIRSPGLPGQDTNLAPFKPHELLKRFGATGRWFTLKSCMYAHILACRLWNLSSFQLTCDTKEFYECELNHAMLRGMVLANTSELVDFFHKNYLRLPSQERAYVLENILFGAFVVRDIPKIEALITSVLQDDLLLGNLNLLPLVALSHRTKGMEGAYHFLTHVWKARNAGTSTLTALVESKDAKADEKADAGRRSDQ